MLSIYLYLIGKETEAQRASITCLPDTFSRDNNLPCLPDTEFPGFFCASQFRATRILGSRWRPGVLTSPSRKGREGHIDQKYRLLSLRSGFKSQPNQLWLCVFGQWWYPCRTWFFFCEVEVIISYSWKSISYVCTEPFHKGIWGAMPWFLF